MKKLLLFLLLGSAGLWAQNQNLGNITVNKLNAPSTTPLTSTFGAQPAGATGDGLAWTQSTSAFGMNSSSSAGDIYGIGSFLHSDISTVGHQKGAVLGWATLTDAGAVDSTGVVGGVFYGQLGKVGGATTHGQGWGINALCTVSSGSDGICIGAEIDVNNLGPNVSGINAAHGKDGITIPSIGTSNGTIALRVTASSPSAWYHGLVFDGGTFLINDAITFNGLGPNVLPVKYVQTGSTTCSSTGIGTTGTCTLEAGSTDFLGAISMTPNGTGIGNQGTATLTFSQSMSTNPPVCIFNLAGGTGGWNAAAALQVAGRAGTLQTINWYNTAPILTSGSLYQIVYQCQGK